MSRRDDRRQRIEDAFAEFQRAVSAALGSVAREHRALAAEHAKDMFEFTVRGMGVDKALQDVALKDVTSFLTVDEKRAKNPRQAPLSMTQFAERLDQIKYDWQQSFHEWTTSGPEQLTELVNSVAAGPASWPHESWLGHPGTHDGSEGVPELWRIGTGVVTSAPETRPFPVAVPLLDQAHLHISSTPDTRQLADTLVESLLLRVLSHFQPGLVHVHVWDVGQLTGSLPGLYPLTRANLLTVHDPARLHELLDELSEHIRQVHTKVLVDGHLTVRAVSGGGAPGRGGSPCCSATARR